MQFELNRQQQLFKKSVQEFTDREVVPRVEELEITARTPPDLIDKASRQGFLRVTVPREFGGTDMGHVARMILLEEVARASTSLSRVLQCLHFGAALIIEFGSETQREKYVSDLVKGKRLTAAATGPSVESGLDSIVTEAVAEEGHFTLNGRECFPTDPSLFNTAVIVAKTAAEPEKEFSAFLVDDSLEGYHPGREDNNISDCKDSSRFELVLKNAKVPADALLGSRGKGLEMVIKGIKEYEHTGIAAIALGLMQASLDAVLKFSNERMLKSNLISNLQAVTFRIAEMYAELESCRLMAYKAAWLLDEGKNAEMEVAAAKFHVSEAALRCTRKAMDSMDAFGCMQEYRVDRYLRDAQLLVHANGTNDIQRIIVGKNLAVAGT